MDRPRLARLCSGGKIRQTFSYNHDRPIPIHRKEIVLNFRIAKAQSISVHQLSEQIIRQYDANGDGRIEINRPVLANNGLTEAYRRDLSFSENQGVDYPARELSRQKLFTAADQAGNHDGEVTPDELETLISGFDQDHNGSLDSRGIFGMSQGRALGELDLFNREYAEERTDDGI
jgi:hypothetical protein